MERERGIKSHTDRVDPTEARDLVSRAFSNGASDDEIARLTGLASSTIYSLRNEDMAFVLRGTHDAIMKALRDNEDARAFSDGTRVSAKWTCAMIHGLMAQGWTAEKQQELLRQNLGITGRFVFTTIRRLHNNLYYTNEQAMRWLVSEIGDATGPSNRSKKFAQRNGYFPTKHYDSRGELIVSSLPKEKRQAIEGV